MLERGKVGILCLLVGAVTIGLAIVTATSAQGALPPGCELVKDATGQYVVQCEGSASGGTSTQSQTPAGPGNDGGQGNGGGSDNSGSGGQDGGSQPVGYPTPDGIDCAALPTPATPPAGAPIGGTQVAGSMVMMCESGIDGSPPFYFWSATAAAAPPPPVDLVTLSRQARARIPIPQFTLEFGPNPKRLAVNMATTFAAMPERSTNLSSSASDQGITVTVTGELKNMSWSPGEPVQCTAGDRSRPCSGGAVGSVVCSGTTCSYVYRWVSSSARTGGAPVWQVNANATWQFSYTFSGAGATTGPATQTWTETMPAGAGTVSMGEWNTVGGFGN